MSKKTTTTTAPPTTTTTLPASSTLTPAEQATIAAITKQDGATGGGISVAGASPTASTTYVPGTTTRDAGAIITFTLPHQAPPSSLAGVTNGSANPAYQGLTTKDSAGGLQMTLSQFQQLPRALQTDPAELKQLQSELISAGFMSKTAPPSGTFDTATQSAWTRFADALIAAPPGVSATTILALGQQAGPALQEMSDIQSKINSAREQAAAATNSNVNLTDANKVAQTFANAMESMGMGAPSQQLTDQFVQNFHNAEVGATVNEVNAQKQNLVGSVGSLTTAYNDVNQGMYQQGSNIAAGLGPNDVYASAPSIATKAAPNLDAEAIAAAKAQNPSMYYASRSADYYGMLQQMLGGDLSQPTTPVSPTSQTATGAIVTTPLAGAING